MKTITILVCLFLCLTSCNDSKKEKESEKISRQEESIEPKDDLGTSAQDQPINQNPEYSKDGTEPQSPSAEDSKNTSTNLSGVYRNSEHLDDSDCSCYCIDVNTNGTSELCLSEDKLYIQGRFEQSGNNINIYYAGKGSQNNNTEIPWDEFDTGIPIAVISPENSGLRLDWKGLSIDGEIAVDYALYGKKTLEGTYKRR